MLIYIEIIPRKITDIVREPLKHIADIGGPKNDACGYKTLDDAVINSENVALGLMRNVIPENLLFVFSQTVEAIRHAIVEFPPPPPSFNKICCFGNDSYSKKRRGEDENSANNRAIILCKVVNSDMFCDSFWTEKKKGSSTAERYEISWRELQKFKNMLNECSHVLGSSD